MVDPMTDSHEAWLRSRRTGIGGSDVAAVLGLSPWRTPLDVYLDKLGEAPKELTSQAAHFGTRLEAVVAAEFSERTGIRCTMQEHMYRNPLAHWEIANIDRYAGPGAILECKTARLADGWGPSQEEEIKSEEVVSDHEIPLYYETQIQWYMGLLGVPVCYVAVLIGGQDFRIYKVDRDPAVFDTLREKVKIFWLEHVEKRIPPDPINAADVRALYARDSGTMREASNDESALIGDLKTVREQIKALEAQEKAIASKIILAIGADTGITIAGKKAATYKAQTSRRFDSTAFKAADPETYAAYCKPSSFRVLRVA